MDLGQPTAMTDAAPVALLGLVFENPQLGTTTAGDNRGRDASPLRVGRSRRPLLLTLLQEEDRFERDHSPDLSGQLVDQQVITRSHPILVAAVLKDCVHA